MDNRLFLIGVVLLAAVLVLGGLPKTGAIGGTLTAFPRMATASQMTVPYGSPITFTFNSPTMAQPLALSGQCSPQKAMGFIDPTTFSMVVDGSQAWTWNTPVALGIGATSLTSGYVIGEEQATSFFQFNILGAGSGPALLVGSTGSGGTPVPGMFVTYPASPAGPVPVATATIPQVLQPGTHDFRFVYNSASGPTPDVNYYCTTEYPANPANATMDGYADVSITVVNGTASCPGTVSSDGICSYPLPAAGVCPPGASFDGANCFYPVVPASIPNLAGELNATQAQLAAAVANGSASSNSVASLQQQVLQLNQEIATLQNTPAGQPTPAQTVIAPSLLASAPAATGTAAAAATATPAASGTIFGYSFALVAIVVLIGGALLLRARGR